MKTKTDVSSEFGCEIQNPEITITAKSWNTPNTVGSEPCRLIDGDDNSLWSNPEPVRYPVDFGLEFSRKITVEGFEFLCPYSITVGNFEPEADEQEIQVWKDGSWKTIETKTEKSLCVKPGQISPWKHFFTPVETIKIRVVVSKLHEHFSGRRAIPAPDGTITDKPMLVQSIAVTSRNLEKSVKSLLWKSVASEPRSLVCSAANDGNPDTYLPLVPLEAIGYEWPRPVKINSVLADFAHFGFDEPEQIPEANEQILEFWNGHEWRKVKSWVSMDFRNRENRANYVNGGTVTAAFGFNEIECRKIRLRFTGNRRRASLNGLRVYNSESAHEYISSLEDTGGKKQDAVKSMDIDLHCDFPVILGQEQQEKVIDWMNIGKLDPHLMEIKSFSGKLKSRKQTSPDALTDGKMDTFWSPENKLPAEIGVEWQEPVLTGQVIAVYRASGDKRYEPAYDGQELQYWNGRQWLNIPNEPELDETTVEQGYTTWMYTIFPTSSTRFRIVYSKLHRSCKESDNIQLISLKMLENISRAHREWMCGGRPDAYGKWLLHGGSEPGYEEISAHLSSPVMRAPVGFRNREIPGKLWRTSESAVSWEGTVLAPHPHSMGGIAKGKSACNWYLGFAFGGVKKLQAIPLRAIRRKLIDEYLPGVELTHYHRGLIYRQTVVASELGNEGAKGKIANFIRIEVENPNPKPEIAEITAATGCHLGYPDRLITFPAVYDKSNCSLSDDNGNFLLWHSAGGEYRDGAEKTISYKFRLAAGEKRQVEFRQALFPCSPNDAKVLADIDFLSALDHFRHSWNELLNSGMRLKTPEERINNAFRATLSQVLLGDHAGDTADGLWPSHYYRAVWGMEDSWNAASLAQAGFTDIAKAIYDKSDIPLTEHYLNHPDDYKHNTYLAAGMVPWYAIYTGKMSGDCEWLKKILPFLKRCCEWIRKERSKTVNQTGMHRGLLPKFIYGADIKEPAYSFWFNAHMWRALRDTGYLLVEMGDGRTGNIYLEEAKEFRELILAALRKCKVSGQSPSAPPNIMYWQMPYAFTPTHYQAYFPELLETGIFTPEEAEECAGWLVEDGRLLCGVQKIYSGMVLVRKGKRLPPNYLACVESQYNLGYQYAYLKRDRVEQYLLGLYGLMAINMDRDFFTGGESNELAVSEADRGFYSKAESRFRDRIWLESCDPDTNVASVFLMMLRQALVMEEEDNDGQFTGTVWINRAAPRGWFKDGETISVENASVAGGKISFKINSQVKGNKIEAVIDCRRFTGKTIKLRLRHPDKTLLEKVMVNNKPVKSFDRKTETIELHPNTEKLTIIGEYYDSK